MQRQINNIQLLILLENIQHKFHTPHLKTISHFYHKILQSQSYRLTEHNRQYHNCGTPH